MSGDRKPKGNSQAMLEAGFNALVQGAVEPAKNRALAAITAAAEAGKKKLLDKADSEGARVVDGKMAELKARSATFIEETFGGSTAMLKEAVAGLMATAHRAETQAGVSAREAAAAQRIQRETAGAQEAFIKEATEKVEEGLRKVAVAEVKLGSVLRKGIGEQTGENTRTRGIANRAEAEARGAMNVAAAASKMATEAHAASTHAKASAEGANRIALGTTEIVKRLGQELKDTITAKAEQVLERAGERIDLRLKSVLKGQVSTLTVDEAGKTVVRRQYLEGEAFTAALVRNGEATVAAAQMLLAANEALANEARELRLKNRTLEVELTKLGHKPEVESRLLELERQVAEGILTGKAPDVSEMMVEIGGERVKLGIVIAQLKEALDATRKAADANGAAAVANHEKRASEPPEMVIDVEELKKRETAKVVGKLADALTQDTEIEVLRGLIVISNDHMDGIQNVVAKVGAEAGKLKDSDPLRETVGRMLAVTYGLDYDNLSAEEEPKLTAKIERAISLLEKHLSHASTAEAQSEVDALEREEQQIQEIKSKVVERFMGKLTELVVALNEQNIGDDEFGARVTADPEIKKLEQLDANLVQERLVRVAQLIGDEVVAKVNAPLKLGSNGDLVTSVESELKARLRIIAEATNGVVSDEKIAEIVSW